MKNKKDMFKPYEEEREKIALKLSQDIPFIDPYYYQFILEYKLVNKQMYKERGIYWVNPAFARNFKKIKYTKYGG